jgi:hypothetical protein
MRRFALLGFVLLLAGCTHYAAFEPTNANLDGRVIVPFEQRWNRAVEGPEKNWGHFWTKDGPLLNALIAFTAVRDDKQLLDTSQSEFFMSKDDVRNLPRFKLKEDPADTLTLLQRQLASSIGAQDFALIELSPAKIAGQDGFRFEFTFAAQKGVETDRRALGAGFTHDDKLTLIVFHAAEPYYFERDRAEIERMLAGLRVPSR